MPWTPVKGFAPEPLQGPYNIGGPGSHSWVLALFSKMLAKGTHQTVQMRITR